MTRLSGSTGWPSSRSVLDTNDTILLPAKHFLQEDQAPAIANAIGDLAAPLG